jgi:hypothetical protein
MTRSTLDQPLPGHLQPLLVSSYSASSRTPARFDTVGLAPAGSASTSPADMGRFLSMLMTGGVVRAETISRMMRIEKPLGPGLRSGLGLGFIVGEYRGVRYAGHGGSMPAGATDLEILPDHRLGWYVAFNGRGADGAAVPLRQELLRAIIDRFYAPAVTVPSPRGPSTAGDIAGKYLPARRMHSGTMKLFSALEALSIAADGDDLVIELESGPTRWRPSGRDRFVEERTGLPLAAERDGRGRIVRVGSPLLNSVSQYEPAPAAVRYLPLLLTAPAVLLLLVLASSAAWLVRTVRGKERRRWGFSGNRAGWAGVWMLVLTTFGWAAFLAAGMVDPGSVAGWRIVPAVLHLLSIISPVAAVMIAVDALADWRDPRIGRWNIVSGALAACAAVAVVWLLFAFDFASIGSY